MIHFEDIDDVDKVLIHSHLCSIQYFLARLAAIPSAAPLMCDLVSFKCFIDTNVRLSDEVPF